MEEETWLADDNRTKHNDLQSLCFPKGQNTSQKSIIRHDIHKWQCGFC